MGALLPASTGLCVTPSAWTGAFGKADRNRCYASAPRLLVRYKSFWLIWRVRGLRVKICPGVFLTVAAFADDITVVASSSVKLNTMLDELFTTLKCTLGLEAGFDKCSWMVCGDDPTKFCIFCKGVHLESEQCTKQLGSLLSADGTIDYDISVRIGKAWQAFYSLKHLLLRNRRT